MPLIWLNPLAQKRKIESKGKGKESQEENKKNRIRRMEGFSISMPQPQLPFETSQVYIQYSLWKTEKRRLVLKNLQCGWEDKVFYMNQLRVLNCGVLMKKELRKERN